MIPKCSLNGYNTILQFFGLLFLAIILVAVAFYYLRVSHSNILEKYESENIDSSTIEYKTEADAGDRSTYPQDKYPGAKMELVAVDNNDGSGTILKQNPNTTTDEYTFRDCKVYFVDDVKACNNIGESSTKTCSYTFNGWKEFDTYKDNNGNTLRYPEKKYTPNASNTSELINSDFTSKCFKEFSNNGKGVARKFEYTENHLVKYDSKGNQNNTEIDTNVFGGKKYTSIQFMNNINPTDNLTRVIDSICSIKYKPIRALSGKTFYKFIFDGNRNITSIKKYGLNTDQSGFEDIEGNAIDDFASLGSHGLRFDEYGNLLIFINETAINTKMNIYKLTYVNNICSNSQIKNYTKYPSVDINITNFVSFDVSKDAEREKIIRDSAITDKLGLISSEDKTRFSRKNGNKYINFNKEILEFLEGKQQDIIKGLKQTSENNKEGFRAVINGKVNQQNDATKRIDRFKTQYNSFLNIIDLTWVDRTSGVAISKKIFDYNKGYKNNVLEEISIPVGAEATFVNATDICLIFKNNTGQNQQSYTLTVPRGKTYNCDILIVAGGGGGGMDMGGGGGGGGVIELNNVSLASESSHSINVGRGGNGAPAGGTNGQPHWHVFTIDAKQGANSSFGSSVAIGGGYGGSSYQDHTLRGQGGNGGSGGGSSGYLYQQLPSRAGQGTTGQGNNGGYGVGVWHGGWNSAGGGGAGERGGGPSNAWGGAYGGRGRLSNILGIPYYWGGGGGGSSYSVGGGNGGLGGGGGGAIGNTSGGLGYNNGSPGEDGCTNCWAEKPGGNAGAHTGGGGGGGSHYRSNNKGGDGGSGIVIIRIKSMISLPTITFSTTDNYYKNPPTMPISMSSSRIQSSILTSFVYLQKGFYRFRPDIGVSNLQNPNVIYAELVIYDESNRLGGSSNYTCKKVFKFILHNKKFRPAYLKQYINIPTNKFYKLAYTYYYINNTASNINDNFQLYYRYLNTAPQNLEGSIPSGLLAWYRFDGGINDINPSNTKYDFRIAGGGPIYPNETHQGRRFINLRNCWIYTPLNLSNRSFSISTWMRTKNQHGGFPVLQGEAHDSDIYLHIGMRGNNGYSLAFYYNDLECGVGTGTQTSYPEDINKWVHITYVVEANYNRKIYRNGVLISRDSNTRPLRAWGNFRLWGHDMDFSDMLIFGRAISEDEIITLYNDPPSLTQSGLSSTSTQLSDTSSNTDIFTTSDLSSINTSLNQYLFSGPKLHTAYSDSNMIKLFSTITYENNFDSRNNSLNYQALADYINKGSIDGVPIDYFGLVLLQNEINAETLKIDAEYGKLTDIINGDPTITNYKNLYKKIKGINYKSELPVDNLNLKSGTPFVSIFGQDASGQNKANDYITFDKVANLNNLANPGLGQAVYIEALN